MNIRHRSLAAACIPPLLACGLLASISATASTPGVEDRLLSQLTGVENAYRPFPWLVTGGQPNAAALEALASAGIRDVFDLRGPDEARGFDEPAVARSLNLHYRSVPVTATDFTDATFTALRHHLAAHGPYRPMFLHCASGNRVGAALLPWLVLDQGIPQDVALEMAHAAGLRNPELTDRALEYIRAHTRFPQ